MKMIRKSLLLAALASVALVVGCSSMKEPATKAIADAEATLATADTIVSRRRKRLWDPDPNELLRNHENPTVYDYGYLREADTLCFWKRERAQLRNAVLGETIFIPACVL